MKKQRPLFLITNDDGIQSIGLQSLINATKPFGDIIVVAPDKCNSGKSHAVTMDQPLSYQRYNNNGTESYICSGTPVDCVKMALHLILNKYPDFLLSGINYGPNASISVVYSGTMAAVIEGCIHGIPSIGFSVNSYSKEIDFRTSELVIPKIISKLISNPLPNGTCLNVNIPDTAIQDINGIKVCRQTKGKWVESFIEKDSQNVNKTYWLSGTFHNFEPDATDTDLWALKHNYISVVPTIADYSAPDYANHISTFEISKNELLK